MLPVAVVDLAAGHLAVFVFVRIALCRLFLLFHLFSLVLVLALVLLVANDDDCIDVGDGYVVDSEELKKGVMALAVCCTGNVVAVDVVGHVQVVFVLV